jgi:diguanylate cyclase (GGDEF)-like protein
LKAFWWLTWDSGPRQEEWGFLNFIDNFKECNDTNGHIAGFEALSKVGGLMKKVFRSSDVLCRYGGDEFVVILPNSDKVGAFLRAKRIKETMVQQWVHPPLH